MKKIDTKIAERVFDMMETFARYGFVKAHSTGYAVIAYQTAYLKTHYPAEFMAAALTNEMGNSSRVTVLRNDCKESGIDILPPDINEGFAYFSVTDGKILFSLAAVKNVGVLAVKAIVKVREDSGKFTDIFDFCKRADFHSVNKKALESLIAAGAFDSVELSRAKLYDNVEALINFGTKVQKEMQSGQSLLFGRENTVNMMTPKLKETEQWSDTKTRNIEKDILGFYLSSHPLEDDYLVYQAFVDNKLEDLAELKDGKTVLVGGVICEKPKFNTSRNNKQFAIIKVEDLTDAVEVIAFSDCIDKKKKLMQEGSNVLVAGVISTREGEQPKIKANDLFLIKEAYKEIPCSLSIDIDEASLKTGKVDDLAVLFEKSPGKSEVLIRCQSGGSRLTIRSKKYKVQSSPSLFKQLAERFGKNNIKLNIKNGFINGKKKGRY